MNPTHKCVMWQQVREEDSELLAKTVNPNL